MTEHFELLDAEDRLIEAACDIARHEEQLANARAILLRWRCHTLGNLIAAHLSPKAEKPNVDAFGLSKPATPNSREGEC